MRWSRSVVTLIGAVSVAMGTAGSWVPGPSSGHLLAASAAQPPPASPESVRSLLDRYCVTCHSERRVTAAGEPASLLDSQIRDTGLALDVADAAQPSANAELWERVLRRLKAGSMPPAGRPRPGAEETRAVTRWLETRLDQAASREPESGQKRLDASPEPHRVWQCDPGPPRARDRRGGAAAWGRDLGHWVRQQRGGALDLDRAARALPVGRAEDLAPGHRRHGGARVRAIRELGAVDAGGPAE